MRTIKINLLWVCIIIGLSLIIGMYLGMLLYQEFLVKSMVRIAEGLEGTNIEINIDLNETQLIEGFTNKLIPILNKSQGEN